MQYQLPNGKVIYMSVEEYLSLSDDELREIASSGYFQDEPNYKSYGSKSTRKKKKDDDPSENEIARSLDYKPESDETDTRGPIDYNNLD
jgi:hypothetical protein